MAIKAASYSDYFAALTPSAPTGGSYSQSWWEGLVLLNSPYKKVSEIFRSSESHQWWLWEGLLQSLKAVKDRKVFSERFC